MSRTATKEVQAVIFRLGEEEYGIEVGRVQEIIRLPSITALPGMPDYVLGITNLRDRIIPIVDLKKRFGFETTKPSNETRVIVTDVAESLVGFVVDQVSEVLKLPEDVIVPVENVNTKIAAEYLLGVGRVGNRLLMMLNVCQINL